MTEQGLLELGIVTLESGVIEEELLKKKLIQSGLAYQQPTYAVIARTA